MATDQELVVSFERLIAPEAIHLATGAGVGWWARCVDPQGTARRLTITALSQGLGHAVAQGGAQRCAGLRLRPSADVDVMAVRVIGSGAGRRVDVPRIVLASAREHLAAGPGSTAGLAGPRVWTEALA